MNPGDETKENWIAIFAAEYLLQVINQLKILFMKELSQEEWRDKVSKDENAVILDVRTELEVEEGYIPDARNIDIYKGQGFVDEIKKLDKSKNYYVYCRSGARSAQACTLMDQLGFNKTYNLIGGFSRWEGEKVE